MSSKIHILAAKRIAYEGLAFQIVLFSFSLIFLFLLISGCQKRPEEIKIPSYEGLEITLVEAKEPHLPGAASYEDSVLEVVKDFEGKKKVKVNVVFLERKEIRELLLKGKVNGKPDLVADVAYSGEWPFCPENEKDFSSVVAKEEYLESSLSYWTFNGKIVGIPSFIHWFCLAFRKDALAPSQSQVVGENEAKKESGDESFISIPKGLRGKVGYWPNATAFYRAALDKGFVEPDKLKGYFTQVKEECGQLTEDPLQAWEEGSIKALYPVNPYLLRWIKVSQGKNEEVGFEPIPSFYTVPGYFVLSSKEPMRSLAQELAVAVARHKGRWAARALGGIPARVQDAVTFHLESGFNYEERQTIFNLTQSPLMVIPSAKEHAWMETIMMSLAEPVKDYLLGETKDDQVEKSILQVLKDHTKP